MSEQQPIPYHDIFDQSPVAMLLLQGNRVIDCNPALLDLAGYDNKAELRALRPGALLTAMKNPVNNAPCTLEEWLQSARSGPGRPCHCEILRGDGSRVTVTLHQAPIDSVQQLLITVQARQMQATRLDCAELVEAQRLAKIGSWRLDIRTNQLDWSDEVFNLFEIDPQKFGACYEAFLNTVHPHDRELVNDTYLNSLKTRQPYSLAHRLLFPDGRVKYVHEACETEFDAEGNPLVSRGTVQNITDRVEAEEKINLYASVFNNSHEAILVTDSDKNILRVNPAMCQLSSYSEDELVGQKPHMLRSGKTPKKTYRKMWKTLQKQDFWQGEMVDKKKNGELYHSLVSVSTIRDDRKDIKYYVAIFLDITANKQYEERIHHLAHHDPLTGLANRYSLEDRLDQSIAQAARSHDQFAVLFIDMDRFKSVNDTLGHKAGDSLLKEVARRLEFVCRRKGDIVARLGGDEFVLILSEIREPSHAALVARTALHVLRQPYQFEHNQIESSPSIGISMFPDDGDSVDKLIKHADIAMYHVKDAGGENYVFFRDEMNSMVKDKLELQRDLKEGLEKDQLELYYQPQIAADQKRVCGVEALLRWNHPRKGMVSPAEFIPLAEESGLIKDIGRWVLNEACRQLAEWNQAGINEVVMAVNLSARQLESPGLSDEIRSLLEHHQLDPAQLELEVTESVAMKNPEQAISQLNLVNKLGIQLAIDDFGTGYSSLAYLSLLPIQKIKLDRSFVHNIDTDENNAAISRATISLSHSLGFKVVAEGVETEAQEHFLALNDCDILQGFRYSKPLPVEGVSRYIRGFMTGDGEDAAVG